jgi:hypothetical protein
MGKSRALTYYLLPSPKYLLQYNLKEKIRTIELSRTIRTSRLKSPIENFYISIKEIANKICTEIYSDRLRQQCSYPRSVFFLDWRDDLE